MRVGYPGWGGMITGNRDGFGERWKWREIEYILNPRERDGDHVTELHPDVTH